MFLIGLGIVCVGFVMDPFSLPFQDFEQMPLEYRQVYETRSIIAQVARLAGGGLAGLSLPAILIVWLFGRRRKSAN